MASLSNSRRQNRKERPNRSANNRDMAERAIRYVVRERVSEWHPSYREAELLNTPISENANLSEATL